MWTISCNPALTGHIFNSPAPILSEYNLDNLDDKIRFDDTNEKFQKSSNLVGSYMGIYGLSSMFFDYWTFYTSNRSINRKLVHMFSLILGGIGFLIMYIFPFEKTLIFSFIFIGFSWGSILSMPYAMLSGSVSEKKWV